MALEEERLPKVFGLLCSYVSPYLEFSVRLIWQYSIKKLLFNY